MLHIGDSRYTVLWKATKKLLAEVASSTYCTNWKFHLFSTFTFYFDSTALQNFKFSSRKSQWKPWSKIRQHDTKEPRWNEWTKKLRKSSNVRGKPHCFFRLNNSIDWYGIYTKIDRKYTANLLITKTVRKHAAKY